MAAIQNNNSFPCHTLRLLSELLFCHNFRLELKIVRQIILTIFNWIWPQKTKSELGNFIIDLADEDCPHNEVHVAAYNNDSAVLEKLLEIEEHRKNIDTRIRPYLATPLRLAATGWSTKGTLMLTLVSLSPKLCIYLNSGDLNNKHQNNGNT